MAAVLVHLAYLDINLVYMLENIFNTTSYFYLILYRTFIYLRPDSYSELSVQRIEF